MPLTLFKMQEDFYFGNFLQAQFYLTKHKLVPENITTYTPNNEVVYEPGIRYAAVITFNLKAIACLANQDGFICALKLLSFRYLLNQENFEQLIKNRDILFNSRKAKECWNKIPSNIFLQHHFDEIIKIVTDAKLASNNFEDKDSMLEEFSNYIDSVLIKESEQNFMRMHKERQERSRAMDEYYNNVSSKPNTFFSCVTKSTDDIATVSKTI